MTWTPPNLPAGRRPTAAQIKQITDEIVLLSTPRIVALTSDHAGVTSNTTQQPTNLSLSVAANTAYWFDATLWYSASTGGDFVALPSLPTGSTYRLNPQTIPSTEADASGELYVGTITDAAHVWAAPGQTTASDIVFCRLSGLVVIGSTAGVCLVTYAQNVSNGTATILRAKSALRLDEVTLV